MTTIISSPPSWAEDQFLNTEPVGRQGDTRKVCVFNRTKVIPGTFKRKRAGQPQEHGGSITHIMWVVGAEDNAPIVVTRVLRNMYPKCEGDNDESQSIDDSLYKDREDAAVVAWPESAGWHVNEAVLDFSQEVNNLLEEHEPSTLSNGESHG